MGTTSAALCMILVMLPFFLFAMYEKNGQPLEVQTGPVIQGNAIRDATGFKFEDFTNQVQFAQLSRAYNREAIKHLPKIDDSWAGKQATVLMAVTLTGGKATQAAALELKQEAQ